MFIEYKKAEAQAKHTAEELESQTHELKTLKTETLKRNGKLTTNQGYGQATVDASMRCVGVVVVVVVIVAVHV